MSVVRLMIAATLACSTTLLATTDDSSARKPAGEWPEVKKLPDPFAFRDGSRVKVKEDWGRRRAELKGLFEDYEYGHLPPKPEKMTVKRGEIKANETLMLATQDLELTLEQDGKSLVLHATLTLPTRPGGPFPLIVQGGFGRVGNAPAPGKPGPRADRLKEFTDRGYAIAEVSFQEAAVDNKERGRTGGVYQLFGDKIDCGALMAWAWGISRVIDAVESDDRIDRRKVVVTGHSRYGKAALVAGAFDERIALTVPSHSGCSGSAPYRFIYGKSEQLSNAVGYAPQWYRPDFHQFVGQVDRLPIDQHLLKALVAPRALLATEGTLDAWTNPQGSQLTNLAAGRVYEFLGASDQISIRFRPTGHIPNSGDLLDFADHLFFGKPLPEGFGKLAYPEEKEGFDWEIPR
jgi:hypothetical protein